MVLFLSKLQINGGNKLYGEVNISGAKNAAVAIIPAVLLVEGVCRIENIPEIKDVDAIVDILEYLGVTVKKPEPGVLEIDASKIESYRADCEKVKSMRASYYLLGALLGRFGNADVRMPGGCNFGERPIDQHIKGFELMGAEVSIDRDIVYARAQQLHSASVYLDVVSVGATINIMLAACRVPGRVTIENAAKEPHIVDVANFLNAMGANIKGAGTDTIRIDGVSKMRGGTYSIIPDQIEAGTYMMAVAATGGDVLIKNIIPRHMDSISAKLEEMGVEIENYDDSLRIKREKPLKSARIKTMPYPGFPTDLQPQAVALLSTAQGTSFVTEGVWENRFQYVDQLRRLGANIDIAGNQAIIMGSQNMHGADVSATDLRAGASLVIAALAIDGVTTIDNVKFIDRGYEKIVEKLTALGAEIIRIGE